MFYFVFLLWLLVFCVNGMLYIVVDVMFDMLLLLVLCNDCVFNGLKYGCGFG